MTDGAATAATHREHIHFVTGRLAEPALRAELARLSPQLGFDYSVDVLGITVAALMTTRWVAARVRPPAQSSRVILPGYCQGDLAEVAAACGKPVERGPRDLRRLSEFFGVTVSRSYGEYAIEILAEINYAPRFSIEQLLEQASRLRADGADVIDIGCEPGGVWSGVGEGVRALVGEGHRVSIDSMNVDEISAATRAGASLVLSVDKTNRHAAPDWGCEVVVVPDEPGTLVGIDETVEQLAVAGVRLRIDPVLTPIGFGFAESLCRYLDIRRRYPDAEMLMGVGNLTELTGADSAAINVVLLGFCEEIDVRSVLTTQVGNWARTSVKECDLARRLVHYAVRERALPKHVAPELVLLRDERLSPFGIDELDRLASRIKDANYRIFAEDDLIHAISAGVRQANSDPFALFETLAAAAPRPIDANHAFYLGYEMAKAATALALGKEYRQDEALDWGFLTVAEQFHRLGRNSGAPANPTDPDSGAEPA